MNIEIYVAMHKILKIDLNEIYHPLLMGSYNKESKNILRDDVGDNISKKNEYYCELTGLYWIWKNSKADIVGLCHYRRFLTKRKINKNKKYFLNKADIERYFVKKEYNMILPKKIFRLGKIGEHFNIAPNKKDMAIVRECIKNTCIEYLDDYDKFINNNEAYVCNVMITTKDIFDEYCEWLFNLLDNIEKNMNKEDYIYDSYRKRMFGFLSERLLNVWILHNKQKLKIKECTLINTEESLTTRIQNYFKQIIWRLIGKNF